MPILAAIKKLDAILDYAASQEEARELLESSDHIQATIIDAFFEKLDAIALKILSESEKQWLITAFVNCALHDKKVTNPDVAAFIDGAVQLKHTVSVKYFIALFGTPCSDEEARFTHYMGIGEYCISEKETIEHSDLKLDHPYWTEQLWNKLLGYLQSICSAEKRFPDMMFSANPSKEDVIQRFREVKSPLSHAEMELIDNAYNDILRFERRLRRLTRGEFTQQLSAHRERLRADPQNKELQHQMLALLRHAIRFAYGKYPYITQMFVILGLLLKEPGRLAQVLTGEGKSTLFIILVAFLASCNKRVHWITSSEDLSWRDFQEAKALLDMLGLTIGWVDDWQQHDKVYDQDILIGTNASFEFIYLNDVLSDGTRLRIPAKNPGEILVAVIDEADNLFIDLGCNAAIIATPATESQSWIYKPLIEFAKPLTLETKITASLLQDLRARLESFNDGMHHEAASKISSDKLKRLLRSAIDAMHGVHIEKEYDLINGEIKIIDDGNTGAVQEGMSWGRGKHACVEVKHGLTPKPDSVTIASISHPNYFKQGYDQLFGLTGTMGSLVDRQEIAAIYGLDCFDVPPHKPKQATIEPPVLCRTQEEQYTQAIDEIADKQSEGHPILVLLPSIRESKAFYQRLVEELEEGTEIQLINDRQAVDKEYIIAQAGHPGVITVATNIAARGTDIRLIGKDNPGLHVLDLSLAENERVKEQRQGRTARQGQKGSYHAIFSLDDPIIMRFIPDESARLALMQHPDFLSFIVTLREKWNAAISKQRLLRVQQENVLFAVFLSFSTCYRACLKDIAMISATQLANYCQTLSTELLEADIPVGIPKDLMALIQRGRSLLIQQDHGIVVGWESFIADFKSTYAQFLRQTWAVFYSELIDNTPQPRDDDAIPEYKRQVIQQFHAWVESDLKPFVELPAQGYLTYLFHVLGVSELHSALFLEQEHVDVWEAKKQFAQWEQALLQHVPVLAADTFQPNKPLLPKQIVESRGNHMKKTALEAILQEHNRSDRQRGFGFYEDNAVMRPLAEVMRTAAADEVDNFSVMQCLFNHARHYDNPIALKICSAIGIHQSVWVEFAVPRNEIHRDQYNQQMFLAMQQCSVAPDPQAAAQSYIQQHFPKNAMNIDLESFQSSVSSCL